MTVLGHGRRRIAGLVVGALGIVILWASGVKFPFPSHQCSSSCWPARCSSDWPHGPGYRAWECFWGWASPLDS
jgi:hypothetical protein